ncbi:MAG TPA: flagellar biosynthetic protein FliO [Terracidiphilus sp.]|jgi:hypothetical protein|nr:flagellar biosynthetic protein FliO [Terracidiphilus sp.]
MNTTTEKAISYRPRSTAKAISPAVTAPGSILFAKALQSETRKLTRRNNVQQIEEPEFVTRLAPASQRGLVGRLFSWFRTQVGAGPTKELRLTETVQLGDKRFVAIIHVEGRKFLIGGGTSGVNLLTQLDEPAA